MCCKMSLDVQCLAVSSLFSEFADHLTPLDPMQIVAVGNRLIDSALGYQLHHGLFSDRDDEKDQLI